MSCTETQTAPVSVAKCEEAKTSDTQTPTSCVALSSRKDTGSDLASLPSSTGVKTPVSGSALADGVRQTGKPGSKPTESVRSGKGSKGAKGKPGTPSEACSLVTSCSDKGVEETKGDGGGKSGRGGGGKKGGPGGGPQKGGGHARRNPGEPGGGPPADPEGGGGGGGEAPPPNPPAPAPVEPVRDLSEWACRWQHTVPTVNVEAHEYLSENLGIPVRKENRVSHGHPVSRVCRDHAVVTILRVEGKGRHRARILDWYGAMRNLKFNPRNGPAYPMLDGTLTNRRLSLEWVAAPVRPIVGDRARGIENRRALREGDVFDFALIQDVYQDGDDYLSPLNPSRVLELCQRTTTGHCYVLFRPFVGEAGCDPEYGKSKNIEGSWFRDERGLIVFTPETDGVPYGAHPDVNWLLDRSHGGVDIKDMCALGPYRLVRCSATAPAAQSIGRVVPLRGSIVKFEHKSDFLTEKMAMLWDRVVDVVGENWLSYSPQHRLGALLVHEATRNHLVNYAFRATNGFMTDSAMVSVRDRLLSVPSVKVFAERDPQIFERIVEGTFFAVLFQGRVQRIQAFRSVREDLFHAEEDLRMVRGVEPLRPPQRHAKMVELIKWVSYAFGLIWIGRRLKMDLLVKKIVAKVTRIVAEVRKHPFLLAKASFFDFVWKATLPEAKQVLYVILTCGVGPFLEEVARWYFPKLFFSFTVAEFGANLWMSSQNTDLGHALVWSLPAFLTHGVCYGLQAMDMPWCAVAYHTLFNLTAYYSQGRKRIQTPPRVREFLWGHATGNPVEPSLPCWCPIDPETVVPPIQNSVTEWSSPIRGELNIQVEGASMSPSQALIALDEPKATNIMYPVLITNGLLWQPANTPKNLLLAVLARIHKLPKNHGSPVNVREKLWASLAKYCIEDLELFNFSLSGEISIEAAIKAMKKRGKRIAKAGSLGLAGEKLGGGKTLTLKWNETLTRYKTFGEVTTIKPRAITNLDPMYHYVGMAEARDFAESLKHSFGVTEEFCGGKVCVINGAVVVVVYASGFTGAQLDALGNLLADERVTVIAASGDDTVISTGPLKHRFGGATHGEGDMAMADQTQDEGVLRGFHAKIFRHTGVPLEVVEDFLKQCQVPYVVHKGSLYIKGKPGWQLPTGTVWTSICNSLTALGCYISYFRSPESPSLETAAADLGLEIKFLPRSGMENLTFLKGWWLPCYDCSNKEVYTYKWFPLPSQVLKLGKCLKDPLQMVSQKPFRNLDERSRRLASIAKVANAMAKGYGHVPRDYPILGPFLAALERCSQGCENQMDQNELFEGHSKPQIQMEGLQLDVGHARAAIMARYSLEYEDIVETETLINAVSELPAYIEHRTFDTLAAVDYGGDWSGFSGFATGNVVSAGLGILQYMALTRRNNHAGTDLALALARNMSGHGSGSVSRAAKKAAEGLLVGATGASIAQAVVKQLEKTSSTAYLRGSHKNDGGTSGSYKSAPVSKGFTTHTRSPQTSSTKGGVRIRHRELLSASVAGSTTFAQQVAVPLNPGLSSLSPWLAVQAGQYEQWRGTMKFEYVPFVSTATSGTITMFVDYNSVDLAVTDETKALDHQGAMNGPVWDSLSVRADQNKMFVTGSHKYVRSVLVAGDRRMYDGGIFYLFTNNCASTAPMGKLFVEYDIEFFVPQLVPSAASGPTTMTQLYTSVVNPTKNTYTLIPFLGVAFDPLGWSATNSGTGLFTPPAGVYAVSCSAVASDSASEASTFQLWLFKNGSTFTGGPASSPCQATLTNAGNTITLHSSEIIVPCNGTDTLAVECYATGATGTLSFSYCLMTVRVV